MRKVTETIVSAFIAQRPAQCGNTATDGEALTLHGNTIAKRNPDGTYSATLAGWGTATTRERLNGLCSLLGLSGRWTQRDHAQQFNGEPVDTSDWIDLK